MLQLQSLLMQETDEEGIESEQGHPCWRRCYCGQAEEMGQG